MKGYRVLAGMAAVLVLLATAAPALADGIIIPEPPPIPMPEPIWLTIRYHRVTVTLEDQVATTRVDQVFVNDYDWEVEGTYIFPLPPGATVSNFTMWVDGEPIEAEVLPADEARAIYKDIVRRRRDPALLEYVGRDVVQARIFPIPPGEERRIQLEYTQVLPVENGMVRYVYPLDTERFSATPLEEVSIRVEIRSPDPIRAVYSPTHQDRVFIERDGEYRATVGYEESDVWPDRDFELIYTVNPEDVGLNLLSYRESDDDGFFLLLVAPTVETGGRVQPKDVLLVLDTSGSMEGEKLQQAKEALAYVLEHLNEEDRFNVIAFSTGLQTYGAGLRPASEAGEAIGWVRRLPAVGGTDINRALLEALAQVDPERPTVLIFLTDGQPTEGVTEIDQILANIRAAAGPNVRLFPFGVGDDVNTLLLDALANEHRGAPGYVRPYERIDEEVSA
ncbi:MAG TPA: VWA domain-containing protein, partial [Anaerolineae bacterium]|nr:VWA domain-containing protein [Anaerolineae bacterium]